jgi:hypothetical protein
VYLHDEIYVLIDRGGYGEAMGVQERIYEFLIAVARDQYNHATDALTRYTALSNLIYYELANHINTGYRQYIIATHRLFASKEIEQLVSLRDEFMRWLRAPANRDRLEKESDLEFDEIARDDAVWLMKYYLSINNNKSAVDVGERTRGHFAEVIDKGS